jgi:uroporphyrinogen decarboxylase
MITQRKYEPDFKQLLKVLKREKPDRPVLFEYFMNGPLFELLTGKPFLKLENNEEKIRVIIDAFTVAGYDYVTIPSRYFGALSFENPDHERKSTVSLNEGFVITDWNSFNKYEWPDPKQGDFDLLNRSSARLHPRMKFIAPGPGGVLENVIYLTGFERLCYMVCEDESLVTAIFDEVGRRMLAYYEICSALDPVGALLVNDDWGFKTQTLLDPDSLRKYVFPWHKKIVEAIHREGKPAILHSCGNIADIMDDIIDELHYDGKHSFEDVILPVEDAYRKWGDRIAILGGMDMNFLAQGKPGEIRERAVRMLEMTGSKGYALGSGNSIPEYIPAENYLAMISAVNHR